MESEQRVRNEGKARIRTNRATEGLCKHFSLFDFCGVYLRANHRTKRHLCTKLVRDSESQCSLTGTRRTNEEKRTTRELAGFYEFDDYATRLECHGCEKGIDEGERKRVPRAHCFVLRNQHHLRLLNLRE